MSIPVIYKAPSKQGVPLRYLEACMHLVRLALTGKRCICLYRENSDASTMHRLRRLIRPQRNVTDYCLSFSGRLPLEDFGRRCEYFTMARDPIDRLVSAFYFCPTDKVIKDHRPEKVLRSMVPDWIEAQEYSIIGHISRLRCSMG